MNSRLLFLLFIVIFFLVGCASSNVSRNAGNSIDSGTQTISSLGDTEMNIADSYQNTNQMMKGAIVGGVTGAITGALASPIGIVPGATGGMILGAGFGGYIDANASLQDQIINRGGNVIILGDQILIMMPSERIFQANNDRISTQAYSTLDLIADMMRSYNKISVKIAAYTPNSGSSRINLALSQQQADSVAKYLWARGVGARVMTAVGYGDAHPVEKPMVDGTDNNNYRIEITLEKIPM